MDLDELFIIALYIILSLSSCLMGDLLLFGVVCLSEDALLLARLYYEFDL
jgi:hypothetical protein